MDARTFEILHKKKYPHSLLTGARLTEMNVLIEGQRDPTFRQLLRDIRDGITETISLYGHEMDPGGFGLLMETMCVSDSSVEGLLALPNDDRSLSCMSPSI